MAIFSRPFSFFHRDSEGGLDPSRQGGPQVSRLRLLIVDENAATLQVMGRRFSHMNYDVALAENGFVAFNMMMARQFDFILVDMGMTMLDGVGTIRKMRASGLMGSACLMAITGTGDNQMIIDALKAGADEHVTKPFDFDVLDARIRMSVARVRELVMLAEHNAALDARIARRAMELGETRAELDAAREDRGRLVASIRSLHDEIERLSTSG